MKCPWCGEYEAEKQEGIRKLTLSDSYAQFHFVDFECVCGTRVLVPEEHYEKREDERRLPICRNEAGEWVDEDGIKFKLTPSSGTEVCVICDHAFRMDECGWVAIHAVHSEWLCENCVKVVE